MPDEKFAIERIVVIGAGAIGRGISQFLRSRGVDHDLFPARATKFPPVPGRLYLVCCSAHGVAELGARLCPASNAPDSVTVVCANGLSILDDLPSGFGPAVRALTFFGANVQQGQLLVHGDPEFLLAGAPDRGVAIDAAAETLGSAGISIRRAGSVEEAEWVKLPINLTVNLLATLADRPNRALVESPAMWEAAQRILGEFTELSRRSGRAIPERLDELLRNALAQHGENINSTLAAVRRGEKTELPWIVGRVIELGARVGVELPVIKTLYALVEARSSR